MSLKIHFLHSHSTFVSLKYREVSDEYGERFHQDNASMKGMYEGNVCLLNTTGMRLGMTLLLNITDSIRIMRL